MLRIGIAFIITTSTVVVKAYTNFYTLPDLNNAENDDYCQFLGGKTSTKPYPTPIDNATALHSEINIDPIVIYDKRIHRLLYGNKVDAERNRHTTDDPSPVTSPWIDCLVMYPSGSIHRADRFNNRGSVHMPPLEQMHRGHCRLNRTRDYLQTAVNAFFILLYGNLQDVLRLPPDYVLKSARTIAMMKLSREKLAATWTLVKAGKKPVSVTYEQLEQYRPLFKYVSAKEMARLNMSDHRILSYLGTHPDLNRHHVGVIASKYTAMNPNWMEPLYLNLMNNLLCGIPIKNMRKVAQASYLQLANQLFFHIHACDPLQRRFYLAMMMRTQALGKSYSWSSRDVTRLGLLLSELKGDYLAAINPEAMSGISAEVVLEMHPENLKHITDIQRRHMEHKPLNILARKLEHYQDQLSASATKPHHRLSRLLILHVTLLMQVVLYK